MPELGMDPEAVFTIASRLDQASHRVSSVGSTVDRLVHDTPAMWKGANAQLFIADWSRHKASLNSASTALHELASKARANAKQQQRTSEEYGSTSSGGSTGSSHHHSGGCLSSSLTHVGHFFEGAGQGLWGMVKGVGTLAWDGVGLGGWQKFKSTWEGIGFLATLGSPEGIAIGMAIWGPKAYTQRVETMGKSLVDWNEWSKDPSKAAGETFANIATLAIPGGGEAGAAADGARAAELAADAGRASDLAHAGDLGHAGEAGDAGHAGEAGDAGHTGGDGGGGHGGDGGGGHGGDGGGGPSPVRLANGELHPVQFSDGQLAHLDSSSAQIADALARHNLDPTQLRELITKTDPTQADISVLKDIRDSVPPIHAGEVMQKAFDAKTGDQLLDNATEYRGDSVGGFVARAGDTAGITSPAAQREAFALQYADDAGHEPFPADAPYSYSVRYTAEDGAVPHVPFSEAYGGDTDLPKPFTGNGFTSSADRIMPEFRYNGYDTTMEPGAEMWRLNADGTEELAGVLGENGRWIRVG